MAEAPAAQVAPGGIQVTVAGKIFGLAVLLLSLTVFLTAFLLWKASQIRTELELLSTHDLPLARSIAEIDYVAARRRLAFERWFGALNAADPDQEVVEEASANFTHNRQALADLATRTQEQLQAYPADRDRTGAMTEVKLLFDNLLDIYPRMTAQMLQAIAQQQAGEQAKAREIMRAVNELQKTVQPMREKMDARMAALAQASAERVQAIQQTALWVSAVTTALVVVLGLLVAWVISRNLTRPIRHLAAAMGDVQRGNLAIPPLPVQTRDEVGELTGAFNFFVDELRAKEMIKSTFGKYIDPRVLERVLLAPDNAVDAISRRVMTVSFADIVGFSSLSERLTPAAMVAVLNRHFELQAQAIHASQGIVDKFMGDAVMAFWGPPFVAAEEHAALACRAALAQVAILDTLRRELPDITGLRKDTPVIDTRVGLCSGGVVVGNIGSDTSRSYTVIGDTVNIASRLEGANRVYGTRILASQDTRDLAGDAFEWREIDRITVKGRSEPTGIHELLGERAQLPAARLQWRDRFTTALQAYRAQQWEAAEQGFRECLAQDASDMASQVFLARLATLRAEPPGADWDGVWQMTSK